MLETSKLTLAGNDVLVIHYPGALSKKQIAVVKKKAKAVLRAAGLNNRIMILTQGLTLQVISQAA